MNQASVELAWARLTRLARMEDPDPGMLKEAQGRFERAYRQWVRR